MIKLKNIYNQIYQPNSKRNGSIEILRFVSIFFVFCGHFLGSSVAPQTWNNNISLAYFLGVIDNIFLSGVPIFSIISIYFSFNKKTINIKWIIKEFIFHILFITLILLTQIPNHHGFINGYFGYWWYIISLILFLPLMPLLNVGMEKLEKKQHFFLCFFFLIVTWLLNYVKLLRDETGVNTKYLFYFIDMYFLIYIFKFYFPNILESKKLWKWRLIFFIISLLISLLGLWIFKIYFKNYNSFSLLGHELSPINIIQGLIIFGTFNSFNIKNGYFSNFLGKISFSYYLLHYCAWILVKTFVNVNTLTIFDHNFSNYHLYNLTYITLWFIFTCVYSIIYLTLFLPLLIFIYQYFLEIFQRIFIKEKAKYQNLGLEDKQIY